MSGQRFEAIDESEPQEREPAAASRSTRTELARMRVLVASDPGLLHAIEQLERLELSARRTAVLYALTAKLASSLTMEETARAVIELSHDIIGAAASVCYFADDDDAIRLVAFRGVGTEVLQDRRVLPLASDLPLSYTVRTGEPLWFDSLEALLEAFPGLHDSRVGAELLRAVATLPLKAGGKVVGGLAYSFGARPPFTQEEQSFLMTLAAQCAPALERARLFQAEVRARRVAEERKARLEVLAEVGEQLSASLDADDTLERLCAVMVPALGDACIVLHGLKGEPARVIVRHTQAGKVGLVESLREELVRVWHKANDAERSELQGALFLDGNSLPAQLPAKLSDEIAALGLGSYALVPVRTRDQALGVLFIGRSHGRRAYVHADVQLCDEIARRVAAALDNARLYRQLGQRERELEEHGEQLATLHRVGAVLAAELDLKKLARVVTDAAVQLSGAELGAFLVADLEGAVADHEAYALSGLDEHELSSWPMPDSGTFVTLVDESSAVASVDDFMADPRFSQARLVVGRADVPRSYLVVLVRSRSGRTRGALVCAARTPGAFGERAASLVQGIAAQASVALENARLFGDAQHLIGALERSNGELDEFASVASHDLRAPLRGIATIANFLEEDLGPSLPAPSRHHLELLKRRVTRMEGLVEGILAYARAGRSSPMAEQVDVQRVVYEAVELLAVKPPAQVTVSTPLPTLRCDRVPLSQVFLNLIGNAIKHAGRPDVQVVISAEDAGAMWEFAVVDNGRGIPEDQLARAFELFQTLRSRDEHESTGIGLAIVKKIVESRGGRAWATSRPNEGATFRFTWPNSRLTA